MPLNLDYFYGGESEQYSFYRIPKVLFTDAHYHTVPVEAKVLYGVYGKAQTLFNLPAAFITPLTISIVPAISAAIARGNRGEAMKTAEDSMRISAAIALPMGVGLAVLSHPIMNILYPNSNEAGPGLLSVMGVASFFVCLVLMENAVLQASGKEKLTSPDEILHRVSGLRGPGRD